VHIPAQPQTAPQALAQHTHTHTHLVARAIDVAITLRELLCVVVMLAQGCIWVIVALCTYVVRTSVSTCVCVCVMCLRVSVSDCVYVVCSITVCIMRAVNYFQELLTIAKTLNPPQLPREKGKGRKQSSTKKE